MHRGEQVRPPDSGGRDTNDRYAIFRRGKPSTLLRLDPDLADGLEPAGVAAARRVTVPVATAPSGPWRPAANVAAGPGDLGFLVVEGLLLRRVVIADTRCTELLGRGDVLRPWSMDSAEMASIPVEADWRIVDDGATFAVLDRHVTRQLGQFPQITCQLVDRAVRRARWLSFQLAVCHTRHVENKLLMVMWHFADRWGKVTPNGIVLDLGLSHETLGEIIGARRPTVTTALGRLRKDGKLEDTETGWLLRGEPPRLANPLAAG